MDLEIKINKDTCFYYWVQLVSSWDSYPAGLGLYYDKWRDGIDLSDKQKNDLDNIKNILQTAKKPRAILSELYSDNVSSVESKEIVEQSKQLEAVFENIWRKNLSNLKLWSDFLGSMDFVNFKDSMKKIAVFLDSNFNLDESCTLYLLQNKPLAGPTGHAINGTNFILFCPPLRKNKEQECDVVSVIVHEYIHLIEFGSKTSAGLFEKSINKHIIPKNISAPSGYSWMAMYHEVLAACFANTITGGYLRPYIYNKPIPKVSDMQGGFNRIVKENRYSTDHIINWAALNILSDVNKYIEKGIKIDQEIVDKVGKVFSNFYLTYYK